MFRIALIIAIPLLLACPMAQSQSVNDSVQSELDHYRYGRALEMINRHLAGTPPTAALYFSQGMAYNGLMKLPEAIGAFRHALALDPDNVHLLVELSNAYRLSGSLGKAIEYLSVADSLLPNPTLKNQRAELFYISEKYNEALNQYLELYHSDTTNLIFTRNIARCYDNLEMKDSALVYYEKAAAVNPADFQSVYRACLIWLSKREYDKGLSLTSRFRTFDSTDARINRMDAYYCLLKHAYDTAVMKFNSCLRANDTSLFVYKYLGVSYFKLETYDTAKIFLEKAYFKDSTDAQLCNFLGLSCIQSYYKKLGIFYIKRAISLSLPDSMYLSGLYKNLAGGYNGFYKPKDALLALQRAHDLNPSDTMLLYNLAWQYDNELKDPVNSLPYYEAFLKTRPARQGEGTERKVRMAFSTFDTEKNQLLSYSYYDLAEKRVNEIKKWMRTRK